MTAAGTSKAGEDVALRTHELTKPRYAPFASAANLGGVASRVSKSSTGTGLLNR